MLEDILNLTIEFFAYNLTKKGITKKLYLKDYIEKKTNIIPFKIESNIASLIVEILNDINFEFLNLEKYSLYDISIREEENESKVAFVFNDRKDSIFKDPTLILDSFRNFNTNKLVEIINKVYQSFFDTSIQFNPIFMIGVLFKKKKLSSIKIYIRFNLEDVPSIDDRIKKLENLQKTLNPNIEVSTIIKTSRNLEELGFKFSFLGIDYDKKDNIRYKIYFRIFNQNRLNYLVKELSKILPFLNKYENFKLSLEQKDNQLWGIAISTYSFEKIDGVQIYYYPKLYLN